MKRYIFLSILVFALLLVLPLPALGILGTDKPPVHKPESQPASSAPSTSSTSSGSQTEGATFKVLDTDTGEVVEIGERDFIIGTVASELYPTYHVEAMKAQAVASYTYYTVQRNRQLSNPDPDLKGADFSDVPSTFPETYTVDGLKARWGDNFDTYYKKITEAVDEVFGKLIVSGGEPILAAYHAISFGNTENAENVWGSGYPYLVSVPSPGDQLSPDFESTVSFSAEEFSAAMVKAFPDLKLEGDAAAWINEDITHSGAGTVMKITIGGTEYTGRQVREALGLRSACFTVECSDNTFKFKVQGYGHGVGMSQYGADYLARQGAGWEEILHTYYTDVEIQ